MNMFEEEDSSELEGYTSHIILTNIKKPLRPLTTSVLEKEILPFLHAIETIQGMLDLSEGRLSLPVRIRSISKNSPESITIDGVSKAIQFIIERVDPNRKKLLELQMAGVELDNRRKKYDLLSDLMQHADKLDKKQKKIIFDAMTTVATSDLRISIDRKQDQKNIEKKPRKRLMH